MTAAGLGIIGICTTLALALPSDGGEEDAPRTAPAPATPRVVAPRAPTVAASVPVVRSSEGPWRTDQVMVVPGSASALHRIATEVGAEVLQQPGRSGVAVLSVPEDWTRDALLTELRASPDVVRAGRQGVTRGAGYSLRLPWNLDVSDFNRAPDIDLSGVTVAVLDTGVAYEDRTEDGQSFVASPCLASATVVAPRDVVNRDNHPNDDHQHGTHIASSIVADCELQGTAPGATLMPVKVLGANNSGVESDLIEGLWWAVDHGADVINMSLTFPPGFRPSQDLLDALAAADAAGVVMVGATGNDGVRGVGWPAASPHVIAVAAGCPAGYGDNMVPAPYSNWGPEVDFIAAGGCLDQDRDSDGYPDGVVAEAFPPGQPGAIGYWLAAGTSQAAANASGAIVRMLAEGTPADKVRVFIQDNADDDVFGSSSRWEQGLGTGSLHARDAVHDSVHQDAGKFDGDRFFGAVMPLLRDNGDGTVTPGAQMTALDHNLSPARYVTVWGEIRGEGGGMVSCQLGAGDGICTVWGEPVPATDGSGARALGWEVTMATIADDDVSFTPVPMILANDDIEQLVGDIDDHSELRDAVLGMWWEQGDAYGGEQLAESLVVLNSGTGIATSPFGVILTPPAIAPVASIADGTGISTSPFGLRIVTFDGTGIATSPFGLKVAAVRGTGIATSPFGVLPGVQPPPGGGPFCLPDGEDDCEDDGFMGVALHQRRLDGGWWSEDHGMGASAVVGSGLVSTPPEPVQVDGAAIGAVPLEP